MMEEEEEELRTDLGHRKRLLAMDAIDSPGNLLLLQL